MLNMDNILDQEIKQFDDVKKAEKLNLIFGLAETSLAFSIIFMFVSIAFMFNVDISEKIYGVFGLVVAIFLFFAYKKLHHKFKEMLLELHLEEQEKNN